MCKKAAIAGLTFNDLRGTAVTRLAMEQCTEAEIATITGHSLRDVRSILDAHYLHRDIALERSAITKLEMGYAKRMAGRKLEHGSQNGSQNASVTVPTKTSKAQSQQAAIA
jgi:hypothetical protein